VIPAFTAKQLADLNLDPRRSLLICDVDEVIVHFTQGLEAFLHLQDLWLDTSSLALNGNIRARATGQPVAAQVTAELIDTYFDLHTETMLPIEGAVVALQQLSSIAEIVLLTNLPHHARDKRIANLQSHGLDFPVVTNAGPKGPAVRHLASRSGEVTVFVDDSPGFIKSAREHAPDVRLVHFLQDERFAGHAENLDFVSLRTGTWQEALPHIHGLLAR
jgi:hypothetical protein